MANARARKPHVPPQNKHKIKEIQSEKRNETSSHVKIPWVYILPGIIISIGIGILLYLKVSQRHDSLVTFAHADHITEKRVYPVSCSKDYEHDQFEVCKPKNCSRVVLDNIVTDDEANFLLSLAKKGLSYGGSNGGASILDLHSGALSKVDKFINIYSLSSETMIFTEQDFTIYRNVKNKIHDAIANHFQIPPEKLYLTKPTFFSRMNTTAAKSIHDEYWHKHIDKETYQSFHYTSLLYLTTYNKDFTGGRFIFVDGDVETAVEPRLGRVSFFTSGSENVHYVEKLVTGVRYAITISFTCDPQMAISDPQVR